MSNDLEDGMIITMESGVEFVRISWKGFTVWGSRESVAEIRRLISREARLIALEINDV